MVDIQHVRFAAVSLDVKIYSRKWNSTNLFKYLTPVRVTVNSRSEALFIYSLLFFCCWKKLVQPLRWISIVQSCSLQWPKVWLLGHRLQAICVGKKKKTKGRMTIQIYNFLSKDCKESLFWLYSVLCVFVVYWISLSPCVLPCCIKYQV